MKAIRPPYEPVVCDYIVDELHRKFAEKFSNHAAQLEEFLEQALQSIDVVSTPDAVESEEGKIRDLKDRPILRAARSANGHLLLTGDRDFLESEITNPHTITAVDFLNLN